MANEPRGEQEPAEDRGAAAGRTFEGIDRRVVMLVNPGCAAAEQYRRLAGHLAAGSARRIGVTSPARGEGRTLTAVNLALALAERHPVLLIDADLRRPAVHTLLGLAPACGLADLIAGRAVPDQALLRLCDGLTVLPAGATVVPHAVLGAPGLPELIRELAARTGALAVVDAPPALPAADLPALAPSLDGLLVVVRAGHTRRDLLAAALASLRPAPILGCVLNGASEGAGAAFRLFAEHDREAAEGERRALSGGV